MLSPCLMNYLYAEITPQVKFSNSSSGHRFDIYHNPYKYSKYYQDSESGAYYLNARYYSPELMRFTSRDTYNLPNRYAYCNGNPISNIDPSGHLPEWLKSMGINAAAATIVTAAAVALVPESCPASSDN